MILPFAWDGVGGRWTHVPLFSRAKMAVHSFPEEDMRLVTTVRSHVIRPPRGVTRSYRVSFRMLLVVSETTSPAEVT